MEKLELQRLLDRLGSDDPEQGWQEFLLAFSALILRIVDLSEHDTDHASECFLFCCERLHEHNFRRLRRFRIDGPASFSTWLTAVTGNLCIDWRRQMFGRERVFLSVRRMRVIEQRAFSLIYDRGLSEDETIAHLRAEFSHLDGENCAEAPARMRRALSVRQQWLLEARRSRRRDQATIEYQTDIQVADLEDPSPNPEIRLGISEIHELLGKAVTRLPDAERLLLQLRYEQDLTLAEIARVMNFKDAFTADRRLRSVLARLQSELAPATKKVTARPCNTV